MRCSRPSFAASPALPRVSPGTRRGRDCATGWRGHFRAKPLATRPSTLRRSPACPVRRAEPATPCRSEDPMLMADGVTESLRAWFGIRRHIGAVLVVFEDLHWGDRPSTTSGRSIVTRIQRQALHGASHRAPRRARDFRELFASRALTTLQLTPLSSRASERLVKRVIARSVEPRSRAPHRRARGRQSVFPRRAGAKRRTALLVATGDRDRYDSGATRSVRP